MKRLTNFMIDRRLYCKIISRITNAIALVIYLSNQKLSKFIFIFFFLRLSLTVLISLSF